MMDWHGCLELIVALGVIVGIWLRLEHRLTRVESRVQERYRDKRATDERFQVIEKWLPKEKPKG
jgi:uncharacterized membrane protein YqgA involved in biofilm formation